MLCPPRVGVQHTHGGVDLLEDAEGQVIHVNALTGEVNLTCLDTGTAALKLGATPTLFFSSCPTSSPQSY